MARPELGTKRACQSCMARFYDLMKSPIACPKCGSIFEVFANTPLAETEEDLLDPNAKVATLVSLDEADIEMTDKVLGVEDDIDLGDDDDSTFLAEDEDENDDVSGLIDSPIDGEEEEQ